MRLAKYLALHSSLSRRQAEEAIYAGRVCVNGDVIDTPVCFVGLADVVQLDHQLVSSNAHVPRLWKCYKPRGCLVTRCDPFNRQTVYDVFPDMGSSTRLVYVGRLDFDSEGLLLFTNTPQIAHTLESPARRWKRTYRVELEGAVPWEVCLRLRHPITYQGITYPGCEIKKDQKSDQSTWLKLTLTEGKKREIRNRLAYLGCRVLRLVRIEFAGIRLEGMQPRDWSELPNADWQHILAS